MGLFSSLKKAIFGDPEADKQLEEAAKPILQKPSEAAAIREELVKNEPAISEEQIQAKIDDAKAIIPDENVFVSTEAAPPRKQVDVAAELDAKAAAHAEDLDWKRSIVDLMKLVGMDSSYANRKEMALELGYSQKDIDDKGSAEMNMWLHKEVLAQLAKDSSGDTSSMII